MEKKALEKPLPLLGAHLSVAGGLDQALYRAMEYRCTALQLFTQNARAWQAPALSDARIEGFQAAQAAAGIWHIAAHAAYLINLATPDLKNHHKSCQTLTQELVRAACLKIPYVVVHPGSHMGKGEDFGIARICQSLDRILGESPDGPRLLLETVAGQGRDLGWRFEELARMVENAKYRDKLGICLDTCHVFAAGYELSTPAGYERTLSRFDQLLGLDWLYLIHANDSRHARGSRRDRHAHIGHGEIGLSGFSLLMNDPRLKDIPKIIETPKEKGTDWDHRNLKRLKALIRD